MQADDTSLNSESNEHNEVDDLITLNGCGKITHWLFPKRQTHCPIETCGAAFGTFSDAIQHFKREHSNNSIFCYLCQKPILVNYSADFMRHYQQKHPGQKSPYSFDGRQTDAQLQNDRPKEVYDFLGHWFRINSSNLDLFSQITEAKDDKITLTALGVTTHWQFPNETKTVCPKCKKKFQNRAATIAHYKAQHTDLCSLCNKPIGTDTKNSSKEFIAHYRRKHPDAELPIDFEETSKPLERYDSKMENACTVRARKTLNFFQTSHFIVHSKVSSVSNCWVPQNERNEDKDNDLITLSGCGRITQWRSPKNLTQCPLRNCRLQFGVRSDAIAHYKRRHAIGSILCSICYKPIRASGPMYFRRHFKRKHPYSIMPVGFDTGKNDLKTQKLPANNVSE